MLVIAVTDIVIRGSEKLAEIVCDILHLGTLTIVFETVKSIIFQNNYRLHNLTMKVKQYKKMYLKFKTYRHIYIFCCNIYYYYNKNIKCYYANKYFIFKYIKLN